MSPFRRGDVNADGTVDITDPITALDFLFLGGQPPGCLLTADANDDTTNDISDPIYLLEFLFLGSSPPPEPFQECGMDPTPGELDCFSYPLCAIFPPNLTRMPDDQSETAVAINPCDSGNVVILAMDWTAGSSGFFRAVSYDGGMTYPVTGKALDDGEGPLADHDPALAFDTFGNLYAAYVAKGPPPSQNTFLFVAVSTDGGVTFPLNLRKQIAISPDRPTIATGPAFGGGPNQSVWVAAKTSTFGITVFGAPVSGLLESESELSFSSFLAGHSCPPSSAIDCQGQPEPDHDCFCSYPELAVGPLGELMLAYNNGAHQSPSFDPTRPVTIFVKRLATVLPPPSPPDPENPVSFQKIIEQKSNVCAIETPDFGSDFIPARPMVNTPGVVAAPDLALDQDLGRGGRVYLAYLDKPVLEKFQLQINAGGCEEFDGDEWKNDLAFLGTPGGAEMTFGTQDATGVIDPAPAEVYKTVRHSANPEMREEHRYNFSEVPNGNYLVRINFSSGPGPGPLKFDYFIENQLMLNDFNPLAAGENKVVIQEFMVEVSDVDGMQGLQIRSVPDYPAGQPGDSFEAAIEILPLDDENHDTNVMLIFSDHPYEEWSDPKTINDDPPGNSQFFHRIAVDQTTGHVALSWYDTRDLMDLSKVRVFAAVSTERDEVTSEPDFGRNFLLRDGVSSGAPPEPKQGTLGDYTGLDFRDGFFISAWGDNSVHLDNPDGRTEVFVERKEIPAP